MKLTELWLGIGNIFASAASGLIGVLIGWHLANKTQKKMLKISEIRNELEMAYGTLYSIVSRPEEMVKVDGGRELRVVVSESEKEQIDGILKMYPHMFPYEIVVLWRTEIRDLEPCEEIGVSIEPLIFKFKFGIPLKFKEKITGEYEKRLQEYYKITGRWESVKHLPQYARV